MSELYTKEELDKTNRVNLRTIAVDEFGMNNTEVSKIKSAPLRALILEMQEEREGGGESKPAAKSKANGKAKTAAKPAAKPASKRRRGPAPTDAKGTGNPKAKAKTTRKPKPEPEPEVVEEEVVEEEVEEENESMEINLDLTAVTDRIDTIGEEIDALSSKLDDVLASLFVHSGLLADIHKEIFGDSETTKARIDELYEQYEAPEDGDDPNE